ISIEGEYLLDLINVYCLPGNIIYSIIDSNDETMSTISSSTSKTSSFKNLEKYREKKYSNVKLVPLNNQLDGQHLLLKLTQLKLIKINKSFSRSYLFAQDFSYLDSKSDGIIKINVDKTYESDPNVQQSLGYEAEQDPMNFDQKQTWPTKDDI
ncbi:unnamed protein product, partial [Rotaria sp. Silwood2]